MSLKSDSLSMELVVIDDDEEELEEDDDDDLLLSDKKSREMSPWIILSNLVDFFNWLSIFIDESSIFNC